VSSSRCSVVVLISGNGSNLQALIDCSKHANFVITAVVSNRADAYGLVRAKAEQIPTIVLDHQRFPDRLAFDTQLIQEIDKFNPRLLVLAGFMRILSEKFVQHYNGKVINIHPSLLPGYRGTNTHQRVLDAGEKVHGVSVHFVTEELDGGPVILQATVTIEKADTASMLEEKIHRQEHQIYPEVVTLFADNRLQMKDNRAWLDERLLPQHGYREQTPS